MDVIISKNLYSVCYNMDIKVDLCMSYWIVTHFSIIRYNLYRAHSIKYSQCLICVIWNIK